MSYIYYNHINSSPYSSTFLDRMAGFHCNLFSSETRTDVKAAKTASEITNLLNLPIKGLSSYIKILNIFKQGGQMVCIQR